MFGEKDFGDSGRFPELFAGENGLLSQDVMGFTESDAVVDVVSPIIPEPTLHDVMGVFPWVFADHALVVIPLENGVAEFVACH